MQNERKCNDLLPGMTDGQIVLEEYIDGITVGYASPEQLGVTQSDARTDIYATGILLNVMLTGKHPTEAFAKGRAGRIIRKCTALNPDDRYQCAEKLSDAL